jgi:opacity protein-like surface antigen
VGFLWFPSSEIPLGFRVDGSYSHFNLSLGALSNASASTGQNISEGYVEQYGGDVDAELDLRMGPNVKEYLFGGFGWYKNRTTLKTVNYVPGEVCFFNCYIAYFPQVSTVSRDNTDWMKSWNAGVGFEFALTDPVSFFVEARFMRITQGSQRMDFVPIRVGLRF